MLLTLASTPKSKSVALATVQTNSEEDTFTQQLGQGVSGVGQQIQEMTESLDRLEALTAAIQTQQVAMARMKALFLALQTGRTEDETYEALRHEGTDLVQDVLGYVPSKGQASAETGRVIHPQ